MKFPPAHERRHLDAKLNTSAGSRDAVARRSIDEAFARHASPRLVLVCAPAGFGKTTALLQYRRRMEAEGVATGWLTLDRSDNDATRLLRGLTAASEPVLEAARAPEAAAALLDLLAGTRRPFALFLDDFEALHEPAALALVRELLERLPPSGRLAIGSRTLPELRLSRLRSRGQLLEIDATQLRFTADETAEFFAARQSPALTAEEVRLLHTKTEGWIAALSLASLALDRSTDRRAFIERFSGSDRMIADYLGEEVLDSQAPEVRDFLLRTSVLRDLEPALCDVLVPGADSQSLLPRLEASNLLLSRMGLEQPAFRFHSMFTRFLRAQLARERPNEVQALHSAAAGWYEQQHRPVPAIDHALDAGDTASALRLLEAQGAELLSQGRMRLLWRWFERLTPDEVTARPALHAVKVWAACFTRGPAEAQALLDAGSVETSADSRTQSHLRALKPLLLAMTDRYEDAWHAGRESLAHLPSGNAFADAVLVNTMSTVFAAMGDNQGARRLLDAARRSQGDEPSAFHVMFSETAEGFIDLQEGRMRQAAARFRAAVTASGDGPYSPGHGNAWAGIPYAASLYESNQLDEAAHLLEIYLPLARDVGVLDQVATGYVLLSRIAFHRGDVDQAYQALTDLEYLGHQRHLRRMVACAHLERARVHLLKGHYPAAGAELDLADDRELWMSAEKLRLPANDVEYVQLGRLRLALHSGDPAQTARALAAERQLALRAERHRRAFKLLLLECIALHRSAASPGAWMPQATRMLETACRERFVRLVLDEGVLAGALLRDYQAATRESLPGKPPEFAAHLEYLGTCLDPLLPMTEPADEPAPLLLEPLTRKELAVLRLLAEGYSNGAMAEKLFVSESTVRTHLRNVYAKVDAGSRTQAVARARRLGLVG